MTQRLKIRGLKLRLFGGVRLRDVVTLESAANRAFSSNGRWVNLLECIGDGLGSGARAGPSCP